MHCFDAGYPLEAGEGTLGESERRDRARMRPGNSTRGRGQFAGRSIA